MHEAHKAWNWAPFPKYSDKEATNTNANTLQHKCLSTVQKCVTLLWWEWAPIKNWHKWSSFTSLLDSWAPSNQYVVIWLHGWGWARLHSHFRNRLSRELIRSHSSTSSGCLTSVSFRGHVDETFLTHRLQQTRLITLNSKIQPRSV